MPPARSRSGEVAPSALPFLRQLRTRKRSATGLPWPSKYKDGEPHVLMYFYRSAHNSPAASPRVCKDHTPTAHSRVAFASHCQLARMIGAPASACAPFPVSVASFAHVSHRDRAVFSNSARTVLCHSLPHPHARQEVTLHSTHLQAGAHPALCHQPPGAGGQRAHVQECLRAVR